MGKFYFTFVFASLFATISLAQSFTSKVHASELMRNTEGVSRIESIKEFKGNGITPVCKFTRLNMNSVYKANSTADAPITETPEGTLTENAYGGGFGYFQNQGYLYYTITDGNLIQLVENNTELYIKNPFSMALTDTWLKGVKKSAANVGDPDTIVVSLPQPILQVENESNGEIVTYYAKNLYVNIGAKGNLDYGLNDSQEIKLTWDGDTLKKVSDGVLAMVTADNQWTGYGDDSITIFKQKDVPTALPAGAAEPQKYAMSYKISDSSKSGKFVRIVKDGSNIYIGDLYEGRDYWIKGTVSGNKVTFEKQYLGLDKDAAYHIYYVPVKVDSVYDENNGKWTLTGSPQDKLEYVYDATTGKMSVNKDFIINYGKYTPEFYYFFPASTIGPWEDKPYTPQAPEITDLLEYNPMLEFGAIKFNLLLTDADGNILDSDQMYYKVYFDDAVYTFTKEKYVRFPEDMTEIPYSYSDNFDISYDGADHTVIINDEILSTASKFGVQAIYKGGKALNTSEISYYNISAGINGISTEQGNVESVKFYDLSGRLVASPASGIYIKAVKMTDGTIKSSKVIK